MEFEYRIRSTQTITVMIFSVGGVRGKRMVIKSGDITLFREHRNHPPDRTQWVIETLEKLGFSDTEIIASGV